MQTRAARYRATRSRQDNQLVVDDEEKSTFPGNKRREGVPQIGLFGEPGYETSLPEFWRKFRKCYGPDFPRVESEMSGIAAVPEVLEPCPRPPNNDPNSAAYKQWERTVYSVWKSKLEDNTKEARLTQRERISCTAQYRLSTSANLAANISTRQTEETFLNCKNILAMRNMISIGFTESQAVNKNQREEMAKSRFYALLQRNNQSVDEFARIYKAEVQTLNLTMGTAMPIRTMCYHWLQKLNSNFTAIKGEFGRSEALREHQLSLGQVPAANCGYPSTLDALVILTKAQYEGERQSQRGSSVQSFAMSGGASYSNNAADFPEYPQYHAAPHNMSTNQPPKSYKPPGPQRVDQYLKRPKYTYAGSPPPRAQQAASRGRGYNGGRGNGGRGYYSGRGSYGSGSPSGRGQQQRDSARIPSSPQSSPGPRAKSSLMTHKTTGVDKAYFDMTKSDLPSQYNGGLKCIKCQVAGRGYQDHFTKFCTFA